MSKWEWEIDVDGKNIKTAHKEEWEWSLVVVSAGKAPWCAKRGSMFIFAQPMQGDGKYFRGIIRNEKFEVVFKTRFKDLEVAKKEIEKVANFLLSVEKDHDPAK